MSRLEEFMETTELVNDNFERMSSDRAVQHSNLIMLTEIAESLAIIADSLREIKEAGEEKHPRADTERDCTRCIYLYGYENSETCRECLTGAVNNFEPEGGK